MTTEQGDYIQATGNQATEHAVIHAIAEVVGHVSYSGRRPDEETVRTVCGRTITGHRVTGDDGAVCQHCEQRGIVA